MIKKFCIFIVTLFLLCIIPVFAFGDEETTVSEETTTEHSEIVVSSDPEHTHNWEVVAFDAAYNVITLKCSECQLVETVDFADCLSSFNPNDEYFSAVDVNNDGVINGRDYSYLVRGFTNILQTDSFVNMFSSNEFLYKEIFFYVYLTVLFIGSTGFICVYLRRYNK